jgi:sigma-B regulation protein RsbU (phosphoserine phosphatase)
MADPLTCFCLDHLSDAGRRALQKDLDLAVQIQFALLPSRDLKVPGWEVFYHYQPAGPVSGDYCDLIPIQNDGGGLLFLAGDVSGKGVAASLLMSNLHAIFRSLYSAGMPISDLVTRANRIFCESTLSPFYATLLCGLAKPSGEVEFCNAGHCPPAMLRRNEAVTIGPTGLPLGLFCDAQYSVCSTHLNPGDTLVAYTDGLTEARNGHDEEYGGERLFAALAQCAQLAPKDVGRRCMEDLDRFMRGQSLADDLTLIVLRHTVQS